MRRLAIYVNNQLAGVLTEKELGRGYQFKYDDSYLNSDYNPISLTLPKRAEPFESEYLFPFFSNLLPEGSLRKVICRSSRTDEKDLFGMLMATEGTDMIGAINVKKI